MGPLCPCPNSKKPMKKVPGASHGAPPPPGQTILEHSKLHRNGVGCRVSRPGVD
ncbi:unnamed protein product [Staurois parvus]|uniref:Uncharacterized protein n=1 Tax=Staurois parvus TaxID=386267 RepID=A0ABN9C463_9NEOB|nr:unnamed protein product [Staurois parvus]